ncbi:redoxin family protein [Belliella kenyensis]|uniref:Redoxin family protein n=1 Tax=Belliella kenyensis TaxID=1472724 RepID=A0ABV8EKC1_9BACT|nr:redoxin family protein [Belliella kenyensis]MCH7403203.1 redoxin family protein [Belliella kenyensis]MDN3604814.1 redoxin family protein [Belliella kenyensis]
MKTKSLLLIVFAVFAFGCKEENAFNPKVIIAGNLSNLDTEEIKLYLDEEIASSNLADDGSFHLSFDADKFENYMLIIGRERLNLFLSPGDSLYIKGDAAKFEESIVFSGDHEAENTYLYEKDNINTKSGLSNYMELMGLDKDAYFHKKDSAFGLTRSRYESIKTERAFDGDFVTLEDAYYEYEPLIYDGMYPMYYAYINKVSQDSVDFPHEEVKAKFGQVHLGREDLLDSRSYTNVVDRRIGDRVSEMMKSDSSLLKDPSGYEKARFTALEDMIENQVVKDKFLFDYIKSNMQYRGPEHTEVSYKKFMKENQSPKLAAKLEALKDKWEPIMPGKEVPDFSFVNIEGEEVNLSDLKGNLVYIDIWATWCGPCIAEHPHWDKMKEEYKDKSIAFLTVSIDDSKDPWEKMVKSKNMEGLQWFAENAWKSELAKHFMVNAIPRFILLDKEGKIIDPSADRPSGNIRTKVDQHL